MAYHGHHSNSGSGRRSSSSSSSSSSSPSNAAFLAGVECYKCRRRGHYANRCPYGAVAAGGGGAGRGARPREAGWGATKVPRLREECERKGLPKAGRKADLVQRLEDYVRAAPGRAAASNFASNGVVAGSAAASAPVVAAAASDGVDFRALFDVDDGAGDAEMADAVDGFERGRGEGTPSLSQGSQVSNGSGAEGAKAPLTEEQRERKRRSLEEAKRRKAARTGSQSSDAASTPTKKVRRTVVNPYENPPTPVRDEGGARPGDARKADGGGGGGGGAGGRSLPAADLPPLPPDAPPVRESARARLSDQQMEVLLAARPPSAAAVDARSPDESDEADPSPPAPHPMVRVNAAAGTGKTTCLVHLAARCADLGHDALTYVTYSRAAAGDARERMDEFLGDGGRCRVSASTLHSCAMRLLGDEGSDEGEGEDRRVYDEHELQRLIKEKWEKELWEYVDPAIQHVRAQAEAATAGQDGAARRRRTNLDGKEKIMFEKAVYYLHKTFVNFLRKDISLEELKDKKNYMRHYYPVSKKSGSDFHEGGAAAKLGFPPHVYAQERSYSFFADTAVELWDYVTKRGIRTFDAEIKKAALKRLRIPCSVLLVDECQDLDECQVTWIKIQQRFGTHIFFVGDSAQCIYQFRGASFDGCSIARNSKPSTHLIFATTALLRTGEGVFRHEARLHRYQADEKLAVRSRDCEDIQHCSIRQGEVTSNHGELWVQKVVDSISSRGRKECSSWGRERQGDDELTASELETTQTPGLDWIHEWGFDGKGDGPARFGTFEEP
ncbi:hypothetical protein ACHAWF_009017 [Thalassiosira exigua]